ncbi:hypothetical protein K491DRAFT_762157 [Lophiostoma macrostomum CBS 122681]|uniref:Rhodopsin domain-containing protein n=1 Tax=Lophiostoma macrostomum CBS 122681 TaxID=1314788 RepID=A0A6A6SQ25_9PLEO|nr:hypothetical protein K491DRAFT_762157 [Lophiostoma macrostomum CBS 122681]
MLAIPRSFSLRWVPRSIIETAAVFDSLETSDVREVSNTILLLLTCTLACPLLPDLPLRVPYITCLISSLQPIAMLFPFQSFGIVTDVFIGLHVTWALGCDLTEIFMCTPIWIPSSDAATFMANITNYINHPVFFVSALCIKLFLDIAALTLPIRKIVKLQLDSKSKRMLAFVFLLGGISFVSGILRIQQTYLPNEPSIDLAGDMFWCSIHEATALIAASLPLYRPLLRALISLMSSGMRKLPDDGGSTAHIVQKEISSYKSEGHSSDPSDRSQRELVRDGER